MWVMIVQPTTVFAGMMFALMDRIAGIKPGGKKE